MKIELFDDFFSLFHLPLGFLTFFFPKIFFIFFFYELVEFAYKNRKKVEEPASNYIGDIVEFLLGYCLAGFLFLSGSIL